MNANEEIVLYDQNKFMARLPMEYYDIMEIDERKNSTQKQKSNCNSKPKLKCKFKGTKNGHKK